MAQWRKKTGPPCPKCGQGGGTQQAHDNCPKKAGMVWIDILTGMCQCNTCNQAWMIESSRHHCYKCGALYTGGEVWIGMGVEIVQVAHLKWIQKLGIRRGVPKVEFVGWGKEHKGCFISSAVFESIGYDDNCQELRLLRNFRDNILLNTQEGKSLVEEYYQVAPSIVKNINLHKNADKIYEKIYHEYLSVCIEAIQAKEYSKSTDVYKSLVVALKEKYL